MDAIDVALKENFGLTEFRPGQKEIIQAFLGGQNIVALLPTGAGKSLCYQLPALIAPGLMIVISPLIALMDDQVQEWNAIQSSERCACWHSHLHGKRRQDIIKMIQLDQLKILMISPEGLQNLNLRQLLAQKKILGVVIDEAHCLYQWGLSFRPAYQEIHSLFKSNPVMLLSATIRYQEWMWIKMFFKLENTFFWVSPMKRANLKFSFLFCRSRILTLKRILAQKNKETGIIYVKTRAQADHLSQVLGCLAYHAGMTKEQRKIVHRRFRNEEHLIVVATMAFGMGVNRGDLRFVIHYGLPYSLSHYAQEAGRAGRDGLLSEALILMKRSELFPRQWNRDHFEILFFLILGPWRSWYLARLFEHRLKLGFWLRWMIDELWQRKNRFMDSLSKRLNSKS